MLTLAVLLGVLWMRGYLSAWIAKAIAAATYPPAKVPFHVPGGAAPAGGAAPGSSGQIA